MRPPFGSRSQPCPGHGASFVVGQRFVDVDTFARQAMPQSNAGNASCSWPSGPSMAAKLFRSASKSCPCNIVSQFAARAHIRSK